MKKLMTVFLVLLLLVGCGSTKKENEKLTVIASYTIISDMLNQIGGDLIEVYNLVPTGTDPHEYEPLPNDIKHATDADLMFYNGLNLEGGESGWFFKLAKSVNKETSIIFDLSEGITPLYLHDGDTSDGLMNPHAYLNPNNGIIMVENALKVLVEHDPENQATYEANAQRYLDTLGAIEEKYRTSFESLDEKDRILVTSERAFQYMNLEYGLKEGFIWAIDTEELGTAAQIKALSTFIKENNVKVLFVESNVDRRPMETVSKETGVPIFKDTVYSDEIGVKGSEVDSYEKMLTHNLEVIMEGLQ